MEILNRVIVIQQDEQVRNSNLYAIPILKYGKFRIARYFTRSTGGKMQISGD